MLRSVSYPLFYLFFAVLIFGALAEAGGDFGTGASMTPNAVSGTYAGHLPCADCPGIDYELVLDTDGTYTESSFYAERSEQPTVRQGKYLLRGDIIELDKPGPGMKSFQRHPHGLRMLDMHGRPITGELAHRYLLTRQTAANNMRVDPHSTRLMQQKLAQGIHFFALGVEPAWTLDIMADKRMRLRSRTDFPEMITGPARLDRAQDADVSRFFAGDATGTLIAQIMRGDCVATPSGEPLPFSVHIDVQWAGDVDYRRFEGCGNYVMDLRLNGMWVATHVGERALDADDFANGLPFLEFHLDDNTVAGSTGCNRISGRCEVRGDTMAFGRLATTRMACPNMDAEHALLTAISGRTFSYTITNDRLEMIEPDGNWVLVMTKMD